MGVLIHEPTAKVKPILHTLDDIYLVAAAAQLNQFLVEQNGRTRVIGSLLLAARPVDLKVVDIQSLENGRAEFLNILWSKAVKVFGTLRHADSQAAQGINSGKCRQECVEFLQSHARVRALNYSHQCSCVL